MDTNNATAFASPLATAKGAFSSALPLQLEPIVNAIANASAWQIALTVFLAAVVYDQSMSRAGKEQ